MRQFFWKRFASDTDRVMEREGPRGGLNSTNKEKENWHFQLNASTGGAWGVSVLPWESADRRVGKMAGKFAGGVFWECARLKTN